MRSRNQIPMKPRGKRRARVAMAQKAEAFVAGRGAYVKAKNLDWDALRDEVDQATCGELDALQLDMLTDMIESRLREDD